MDWDAQCEFECIGRSVRLVCDDCIIVVHSWLCFLWWNSCNSHPQVHYLTPHPVCSIEECCFLCILFSTRSLEKCFFHFGGNEMNILSIISINWPLPGRSKFLYTKWKQREILIILFMRRGRFNFYSAVHELDIPSKIEIVRLCGCVDVNFFMCLEWKSHFSFKKWKSVMSKMNCDI